MEKWIGTRNRSPEWRGPGTTTSKKGCHVVASLQGAHSGFLRKQCAIPLELVAPAWGYSWSRDLVFLHLLALFSWGLLYCQAGLLLIGHPRGGSRFLFYQFYNLRTFSVDVAKDSQMSLLDLTWVRCSFLTTHLFGDYVLMYVPIIHSLSYNSTLINFFFLSSQFIWPDSLPSCRGEHGTQASILPMAKAILIFRYHR